MADWILEAAESNCAIDQQKAGLKSKEQSASCYLKDALHKPGQAGSHHSCTII